MLLLLLQLLLLLLLTRGGIQQPPSLEVFLPAGARGVEESPGAVDGLPDPQDVLGSEAVTRPLILAS